MNFSIPPTWWNQLGLKDPDLFIQESRKESGRFANEENRRTGRSTRLVLEGLAHIAETGHSVKFVAANIHLSQYLMEMASKFSRILGVEPKFSVTHDATYGLQGLTKNTLVLHDPN